MSQHIKKKLVSMQIKMAQNSNDSNNNNNNKSDNEKFSVVISEKTAIPTLLLSDGCSSPTINKYKICSRELGKRALKTLINKLRLRSSASADISPPDPSYKVVYLGNVLTGWAKGENCVEKPLSTLWRNYTHSNRADVRMQLTVSGGGLRATTSDHGLTEYWANRISFCAAPTTFPRLFCWVYRHEGRRLRHELRCHAVLCSSASIARKLSIQLRASLTQALAEFKRDKISRQKARLSLVNSCYENPSMPRRKILLSTGSQNYRPPLERSKSAPKLTIIEENLVEEEGEDTNEVQQIQSSKVAPHMRQLKLGDSTSLLIDKHYWRRKFPPKELAARLPSLEKCFSNCTQYKKQENIEERLSRLDEENESTNHSFQKRNFSLRRSKSRRLSNRLKSSNKIENSDCNEETPNTIDLQELTIEIDNIVDKEIIEELIKESLNEHKNNETINDCSSRLWSDSDEGSLSSGCESGTSTSSDLESCSQSNKQNEILTDYSQNLSNNCTYPTLDFKIGSCVLARVRSLERLAASTNNNGIRTFQNYIPEIDDVSLIPVGEISQDFNSLRLFKKKVDETKSLSEDDCKNDDENCSVYSDESGYGELIESINQQSPSLEESNTNEFITT